MNPKKTILLVLLLCVCNFSWAGWKIVTVSTDAEGNEIETVAYFEDGKIRLDSEGMIMIFDVNSASMMMISPEYNVHWSGTLDQMVEEIETIMGEMVKMMGEEAYQEYVAELETQKEQSKGEITGVEIVKDGEAFEAAGFTGYKYRVLQDGDLKEEIWLTEEISLSEEVDIGKFLEFLGKSSMGGPEDDGDAYLWSKSYIEFSGKGYWTKTIGYQDGMEASLEVLKEASRLELPMSHFEPQAGSTKVTFMELFQSMMGQ